MRLNVDILLYLEKERKTVENTAERFITVKEHMEVFESARRVQEYHMHCAAFACTRWTPSTLNIAHD